MRFGIVRFPGSNCDFDCERAVRSGLGEVPVILWHKEESLLGADIVLLPGGFSYGDHLRAGAIARFSPIMKAVRAFAAAGGPVLGICNGFQILCEAHLLPGALIRNRGLRFRCHSVYLRVESTVTPFTGEYGERQILCLPIAHGEGQYVADADTIDELERDSRVIFRYVDRAGETTTDSNPNGSLRGIAGVCSAKRNVVGLMPHPERAISQLLGSADGLGVFQSAVAALASLEGVAS
ncbi:MAG: phosphoribosylformylglycinamidine synthase subunit PurQ [Gemmatimonadota bacterium]